MSTFEVSVHPRCGDEKDTAKVTHIRAIVFELEMIPGQDTPVRSVHDIYEYELAIVSIIRMARHLTNFAVDGLPSGSWAFAPPWTMPPFKNGASVKTKFVQMIEWVLAHPQEPSKPMDFDEFVRYRRFEPHWDMNAAAIVEKGGDPCMVYPDGLYIELLRPDMTIKDCQYFLTIENQSWSSDDLAPLEKHLYEFYRLVNTPEWAHH